MLGVEKKLTDPSIQAIVCNMKKEGFVRVPVLVTVPPMLQVVEAPLGVMAHGAIKGNPYRSCHT